MAPWYRLMNGDVSLSHARMTSLGEPLRLRQKHDCRIHRRTTDQYRSIGLDNGAKGYAMKKLTAPIPQGLPAATTILALRVAGGERFQCRVMHRLRLAQFTRTALHLKTGEGVKLQPSFFHVRGEAITKSALEHPD